MKIKHAATPAYNSEKELKTNDIMIMIQDKTPAELAAWVDANIKSVADMRTVVVVMLLLVQSLGLNK